MVSSTNSEVRNRIIKPSFFLNDELADCSPLARLFFVGLWCAADSHGRLEVRPKRLKAEILPFDDCDVVGLIDELKNGGFLLLYEADGVRICQIPTFRKHQRISGTEASAISRLAPPPKKKEATPASRTEAMPASPREVLERKEDRKEERTKEEKIEERKEGTLIGGGGVQGGGTGGGIEGEEQKAARFAQVDTPRLEDALLMAHMEGIPQDCAEKWWNDNDARNWLDSRGIRIEKWRSSFRGYFVSWRSYHQKPPTTNPTPQPKGDPFWKAKMQLDLVSGEIKAIEERSGRDALGNLMVSEKDRPNLMQLKKQRAELKKTLGLTQ